ncbi:hypothetical protein [Paraclostridium sordellii]|uniref:hypothetical protein n=1 Tax=Paraclostridium sordellii TaxID=1505 RepID=UPI0005EA33CD|nr:hypothetical protein [Paeniclostridium sordellii]MCR1848886.1 hypothetical protein [Paeniclostridium sordellii]CEQ27395.1 Uncharacterised protein [[Clostridium] sordellii] [Paeniclostridium sordellii]
MINKQSIFLFLIAFGTITTLCLYMLKSNRNVYYKNDERWHFIQNKANTVLYYLNQVLVVFVVVTYTIVTFYDIQITVTLNRIFTYIIIFIGLRNSIELFALKYFDKQI